MTDVEEAAAPEEDAPTLSTEEHPAEPAPRYTGRSVANRVREARLQSTSKVGFAKELPGILAGSAGCIVCLGVMLVLPLSMIIMGALYYRDCPVQRFIPIYLLVAGVFAMFTTISQLVQSVCMAKDPEREWPVLTKCCKVNESLVGCFVIIWFFLGNYWIYSTFSKFTVEEPASDTYCHYNLYWYAFWITTTGYILLGVVCLVGCIGMCCVFLCTSD